MTWAAVRDVAIGLAARARSNHSCIVGRSATRSSSLLMKSERLMPSRAARALRVLCTESGTSRTFIIFDMFKAYKHVQHMSTCRAHRRHCCIIRAARQLMRQKSVPGRPLSEDRAEEYAGHFALALSSDISKLRYSSYPKAGRAPPALQRNPFHGQNHFLRSDIPWSEDDQPVFSPQVPETPLSVEATRMCREWRAD